MNDNITFIEFILDETGSMTSWASPTITGFNEFLAGQRKQPGQCLLTLTKFHTGRTITPYTDLPADMVPMLCNDTFVPGSSTNLRDTILDRIASVEERLSTMEGEQNVVIIALTDGGDNASEKSEDDVRSALKSYMDRGWTFVFLGAYEGALPVAESLGFPEGNSKSFKATEIKRTMAQTANATTAYRSARTSGLVASGTTSTTYFSE